MKTIKNILILIFILLLLFLGLYTGSFGHSYKSVYNFFLSFVVTIIFFNNNKKEFLIIYVIIAIIVTYYLFYINDFKLIDLHTLSSLSLLLGIIFGCIYYYFNFKITTLIISILLNYFVFFYGYEIWLNKLHYGTFFGNVNYGVNHKNILYDFNDEIFNFEKDKIYVLDFWTTTCGVCFQKFPKFEQIRNKFQDEKIIFYAVNYMYKEEDIITNNKFLFEKDFFIPTLFFKDDKLKLSERFKVNAFPTIIIIQNDKIIFKGSNVTLSLFLSNLNNTQTTPKLH